MASYFKKIKDVVVSLRFSILTVFVTLFISTVLLIILITSIRFSETLSYMSSALMKYASREVLHELNSKMRPVEVESEFTAQLLQKGILHDDYASLLSYSFSLLKSISFAQRVFWADEYGDYIYSVKEKDGSIRSEMYLRKTQPATHTIIYRDKQGNITKQVASNDFHFDPRQRFWYIQIKNTRQPLWTDIFPSIINQPLGMETAAPIFDKNGKFMGAFGVNISVDYLTDFITKQYISPNGFSFIITAKENLVAYPKRPPFNFVTPHPNELINVHKIGLPLIDESIDLYKKTHKEQLTIDYNGESYLVMYTPVPILQEYGWLIGVIVPKKDFTGVLQTINILTTSVSLIILLLGIFLVSSLVSRIVRPINRIIKEVEKIKKFELDEKVHIQSHIKEVILLNNAVESMKLGLKSFQKYVPKILVRQLIESGDDIRIGGARKELTVFFSDIENFTTIAESMDANELMEKLCQYFEEMSHIIITEKGTIDKYIGDAVMAFWGAPLPVGNPCYHAARAALACQRKLANMNEKWKKQGDFPFFTRIGIHTGDAIVGNLGSSERLNYTALGDTTNIASRLEQVNKIYKTHIIVSEEVYQKIKDSFVLRMIDCVALKGKIKSSFIYELISDDINNVPFDIHAYRLIFAEGFDAYKDGRWTDAIIHFKKCLQIYPNDTISPIFILRCEQFKTSPPAPGWNGVAKVVP